MTKYYIHLFTVIVLASSTWLAVGPAAYEKGGLALAILACAFSALVEFFGYLSHRHYDRSGDTPFLIIAGIILIASASFTYWGATLMEAWMTDKPVKQSLAQQQARVSDVTAFNQAAIDKWSKGYREWQARIDGEIAKLESERIDEVKRTSRSKEFEKNYLAKNPAWYRRQHSRSVEKQIKVADAIWEEWQAKIDKLRNEEYPIPKPQVVSIEPIENAGKEEVELIKSRAAISAKLVRAIDIIGLVFGIFVLISSMFDEEPYIPRNPWSEGIISAVHNQKERFGAMLSYNPEQYAEEEKQYIFEQGVFSVKDQYEGKISDLENHLSTKSQQLDEQMKKAELVQKKLWAMKAELAQEKAERAKLLARVGKASEQASRASEQASIKASRVSREIENPAKSGRVDRVERVSEKASRASSAKRVGLSKTFEFEGKVFKSWDSFKGSLRSLRSRIKNETDAKAKENLQEEYNKRAQFLYENTGAKTKKIS